MNRKRKNTIILTIVLAILLLSGLAAMEYRFSRSAAGSEAGAAAGADSNTGGGSGVYVVLQLENQEFLRLDIAEDADLTVRSLDGGYNQVHIEDNMVWVTDADCGDLTCVRTGKARQPGQAIVCLPHRLVIFLEEVTQP